MSRLFTDPYSVWMVRSFVRTYFNSWPRSALLLLPLLRLSAAVRLGSEASSWTGPYPDKLLYIGILSNPYNTKRRDAARSKWVSALRHRYPDNKVHAEFLIGRRPLQGQVAHHPQGTKATPAEVQLEANLTDEVAKFGDIARLPLLDDYDTLSEKVLLLLSRGLQRGYSFMLKIDDDQEFNASQVEHFFAARKAADPLYAGNFLWDKQAFPQQSGVDGQFVKYFGGPCYAVSWELARNIADQDLSHSVAYNMYGSKSEDVNMGRWVQWDNQRRQRQGQPLVNYLKVNLSRNLRDIAQHEKYLSS